MKSSIIVAISAFAMALAGCALEEPYEAGSERSALLGPGGTGDMDATDSVEVSPEDMALDPGELELAETDTLTAGDDMGAPGMALGDKDDGPVLMRRFEFPTPYDCIAVENVSDRVIRVQFNVRWFPGTRWGFVREINVHPGEEEFECQEDSFRMQAVVWAPRRTFFEVWSWNP